MTLATPHIQILIKCLTKLEINFFLNEAVGILDVNLNDVIKFPSSFLSLFFLPSLPPCFHFLFFFVSSPISWLWLLCQGRWLLKWHPEYHLFSLAALVKRDKLSCMFGWQSLKVAHISLFYSCTFSDCEGCWGTEPHQDSNH